MINKTTNVVSIRRTTRKEFAELAAVIRQAGSADGVNLDGLKVSQLGMLAARLTPMRDLHHGRYVKQRPGEITVKQAAVIVGVDVEAVSHGRVVLRGGTAKEIARVEAGEIGVKQIADLIRQGLHPERRAAAAAVPNNRRGRSPERIARQRLRAEIWGCLRAGLEGLTGLPRPADVAALVRDHGTRQVKAIVDDRLLQAQEWLGEFADEWTRPKASE